jgi:S1-C subfamily serine protease
MKEPSTVTLSTEEMILALVQSLDEKVDELTDGQADIKSQIATHEERSLNQGRRIERVEKVTGGISLAVVVAVISIVLSGCGFLSGLTQAPTEQPPAPPKVDVVARAVKNTVALHDAETGARFCSGVAAAGAIITAAHCVDGDEFTVLYQGEKYPGVTISMDSSQDWAIVAAVGARLRDSIPLAEAYPSLGNKVVWMGYPLGEDFIMGTGIIGNPRVTMGTSDWIAIYGQFIPGNSGGPVFNYKGELVGIVSATMVVGGTYSSYLPVGYAVPLDYIKAAL